MCTCNERTRKMYIKMLAVIISRWWVINDFPFLYNYVLFKICHGGTWITANRKKKKNV